MFCICALGMPLPSENALRMKVGLTPNRKFFCDKDGDSDDDDNDENWKPYKPKPSQLLLQSTVCFVVYYEFFSQ